ncbi:Transcriptional regulator, LysR family [Pseudoalteromonas luteoviolacea B = ATCC 29581]|nr:Transcriptional regulator, LysR family [Pseudoalteromonas luteoviolacea B = ATCC 29581]
MTNNDMFDGIPVFVQVVKQGGFAKAAEALGHSNSHVSKTLSRLEARVGARLLNRTTRSIALTPEGEVFYQHCVQLVNDAEQALSLIDQADQIPKGELKLSCPIALAQTHIEPVLSDYLSRFPNVTLDLDLSDKHIDLVAEGYDLAIRATTALSESSLICRKIGSSRIVTVAAKTYLERYGRPYHPQELSQHHCICYSNLKSPTRWEYINSQQNVDVVQVRQRIRCNNGHMQTQLVHSGQGIARLPLFYVEKSLEQGQLEQLFESYRAPEIGIYALYPSRKHLSPKVRKLIDMLQLSFGGG